MVALMRSGPTQNFPGSPSRSTAGRSMLDRVKVLSRTVAWQRSIIALAGFFLEMYIWYARNPREFNGSISLWIIAAVSFLGYCTLVYSRSFVPAYLTMLVLSTVCLFVPGAPTMMAGFLIALFFLARHLPPPRAYLALPGAIIPILTASFASTKLQLLGNLTSALPSFFVMTLLVLSVWFSAVALSRYEHALRTERAWAIQAREEATIMERLRISRDLHDSVAHALTAIVLQTAGLRTVQRTNSRAVDWDAALADVQQTAEQSIRELHRLLGILRSEDTKEPGSLPRELDDIAELIDAARASGVEISEKVTGTKGPIDPSIGHAGYRVVQESLSNVMRHAGQGAKASVEIHWDPLSLTIVVRSISGAVKTPGLSGGFGLVGLRERVTISGGTLVAEPTKDGFLVKAVLPAKNDQDLREQAQIDDAG
ncbi:sensor histidine kinase [Glutamicibacter ardleyensis]|uniref:histidine kinase n=1 Tax=Glutamicibacter ardleyensis TaxID=225894 RepID=A0ABQ2DGS3_9MICC|nr:histidine kinase [Glutamicibacter ardleyensis]GGJ56806.1 hypothetical protein GCM10007173_14490 [Glutamicibacter ardleyensis]